MPKPDSLDDHLGRLVDDLLRRAASTQRLAMERALAPLGLTPAQFAALESLSETPGLSGAELARGERITPQTCSVIVANLERKEFVARRRRAAGGRAQHLELTEEGAQAAEAGKAAVATTRAALIEKPPANDIEPLVRTLRAIANPRGK